MEGSRNTASGEGHISAYSLLANVWYEFNIGNSPWKPYVGGGAGIAWVDLDAHGRQNSTSTVSGTSSSTKSTGVSVRGEESGFAWQLGAGIGYEFAPGKQITLDYRYFRGPAIDELELSVGGSTTILETDYDYKAHNIMLGVKIGL